MIALVLSGCATPQPATGDGVARAGLNQRVYVDGPYVTPLAVIEDSRCPVGVRCISAGRIRITVRIDLGARSAVAELSSDKPLQVADGLLSLVEVQPALQRGEQPGRDSRYRFGMRFTGGI
ncbi:MAG TPA: hypothetical protein VFS49_09085 [Croceibacterium sp.]|nr:hypothetical protein [Croceibacterium sp.]